MAEISEVSGLDVTADYAMTGTATGSNNDYSLANGTVSILAGSTNQTLSLTVVDDKVVEEDEWSDEPEEPKKIVKKKNVPPEDDSLDKLIDDWDE